MNTADSVGFNGDDGAEPDGTGPNLVRPYSLTSGRTRPTVDLALEALIEGLVVTGGPSDLNSIEAAIVEMSHRSPSVAEIAARTGLPVGVTRVLVADLVERGYVRVMATLQEYSSDSERRELIERVLSGLRQI